MLAAVAVVEAPCKLFKLFEFSEAAVMFTSVATHCPHQPQTQRPSHANLAAPATTRSHRSNCQTPESPREIPTDLTSPHAKMPLCRQRLCSNLPTASAPLSGDNQLKSALYSIALTASTALAQTTANLTWQLSLDNGTTWPRPAPSATPAPQTSQEPRSPLETTHPNRRSTGLSRLRRSEELDFARTDPPGFHPNSLLGCTYVVHVICSRRSAPSGRAEPVQGAELWVRIRTLPPLPFVTSPTRGSPSCWLPAP